MTPAEFSDLLDYSTSTPTGARFGKKWKRNANANVCLGSGTKLDPEWWLGKYYDRGVKGSVGIMWKKIVVIGEV